MKINKYVKCAIVIVPSILLIFAILIRLYAEHTYREATNAVSNATNVNDYKIAADLYGNIYFFKDSTKKKNDAEELAKKAEANIEKAAQNQTTYEEAIGLFESGAYSKAMELFLSLGEYKDSKSYTEQCQAAMDRVKRNAYQQAIEAYSNGSYFEAIVQFEVLEDYGNSQDYIEKCYDGLRKAYSTTFSAGSLYSIGIGTENLLVAGDCEYGQNKLEWNNLISVSAGGFYTIGLYEGGSAIIAGDMDWRIDNLRPWEHVLQVTSGFDFAAVLLENGQVEVQGNDEPPDYTSGEFMDYQNWRDIVQIDAGYHLLAGLSRSGKIFVTGKSSPRIRQELAENPEKWENVVAIAVGGDSIHDGFIAGLKADGKVVTAGFDERGIDQAENWSNIKMISAADYHLVGIDEYGTPVAVMNHVEERDGKGDQACCEFEDWDKVKIVAVEAGNGTTLGMAEDGTIYASGYNVQRQRPKNKEWTVVH